MAGNPLSTRLIPSASRRGVFTRRRFLASTVGTALLLACGTGARRENITSPLLSQPADRTADARRGGVLRSSLPAPVAAFDPMQAEPTLAVVAAVAYSRLTQRRASVLAPARPEAIDLDLAEGWELSPDGLQLTLRLNPEAHFAPIAPMNGRGVDSADVAFSWQRFIATGANRPRLANAVDPAAPVVSVTATDSRTVVLRLSEPCVYLPALLAAAAPGGLHILPREADDPARLDLARIAAGSGPFYVTAATEERIDLGRNPGYHDSARPYVDGVSLAVLPDYSDALTRFRDGGLHTLRLVPTDVLDTKRAVPVLSLVATDVGTSANNLVYGFGAGSPFRDVRVRQALARSWDRDTWLEDTFAVLRFRAQGLPVTTRWSTAVRTSDEGWWLDPKNSAFGRTASFYYFDPADARKLLAAAGFKDGLDAPLYLPDGMTPSFQRQTDALRDDAANVGLRLNVTSTTGVDFSRGGFTGVAVRVSAVNDYIDPAEKLFAEYNARGELFPGFDAAGRGDATGDPRLDELTRGLRRETDLSKRIELARTLQRYEAEQQYRPYYPGSASGFGLAWPALANFNVHRGDPRRFFYEWLDVSQAPFG